MQPGTILFHRDFAFRDGGSADKLLVVLGSNASIVLVAKTTSRGHRYRNDHGCQAGSYFPAFLLTQGCCFLQKNTWVCLSEFYELTVHQLNQRVVSGVINRLGVLPAELAMDVQVCAAQSDDISIAQETLVRACFIK